MPEETAAPFISSLNRQVATGPVTALAAMAGIHIFGLRTMLPICSIEVPSPCETTPPQPFSLNETTAKPTMFAQQPARAAPPARPVRLRAAQIAAEDIGSVSAMPTDDGNEHAHDKRLLSRSPFYERSDGHCALADGGRDEVSRADADEDRDYRRHENVDLSLLRDHFAKLGCDYRDDINGKRSARAAMTFVA